MDPPRRLEIRVAVGVQMIGKLLSGLHILRGARLQGYLAPRCSKDKTGFLVMNNQNFIRHGRNYGFCKASEENGADT